MQIKIQVKRKIFLECVFAGLILVFVISPAVPKNLFQEQKEKAPTAPGEAGDSACLSSDKLESQGLIQIGNLNKKALNKKQPKYPYEAKKHKLSGTVIVDVIVDLPSGKIEKAKIRKTNDFFKAEVIKVVCGVKFPPLTDIDIKPSQAFGYLTYTFKSPK